MLVRKKKSPWLVLILALLLVFAAFLGTYFRQSRGLNDFEALYGNAAEVPAQGISAVGHKIGRFFSWMVNWERLQKENDSLEAQCARLQAENQMLSEQAHQLEDQLTLQGTANSREEYSYLCAHISGKDGEGTVNRFLINKGSRDGVEKGMCVVGNLGLVGRIVEVGPTYSRVGTILDPAMAVSVVAERSRDEGVLEGGQVNGGKQTCELLYLPFDADLVPGDTIVTTDLGQVYPRGLEVGTVSEVSLETNANVTAKVEPVEDMARLENVLVILSTPAEDTDPEDQP